MAVECELKVEVSFPIEEESMSETLLPYYISFSEEFTAAGLGECGPPLILPPQAIEFEGVKLPVAGTFKFYCNLTLSQVESALKQLRKSFPNMIPAPNISVTLYERQSGSRIRLYPHNDIEDYLSGI